MFLLAVDMCGWCTYYNKGNDNSDKCMSCSFRVWALNQELCPRCIITGIKRGEILYCIRCDEFIYNEHLIEDDTHPHMKHPLINSSRSVLTKVYEKHPELKLFALSNSRKK